MSAGVLAEERRATEWRLQRVAFDVGGVTAFLLPFAAVLYLALEGGGYDAVVRSQVGLLLWWMVLIGAFAGVVPVAFTRRGWVAVGLLAAFAAWTAMSLSWTESSEKTVVELGRVVMLLGALCVGLAVAGRERQRQVVGAVAAATAIVATLGVMSRLRPEWFPENDVATGLGDFKRLSYPLNYWNGLAAFIAMGLPAMLSVATGARSLVVRAVAAGAIPIMGLCVFLTESRGGLAAAVLGLVVFVTLAPDRLPKLATLGVTLAGTGILYWALGDRDDLRDGLATAAAQSQADSLMLVVAIAAVGVAFVQYGIALADRHAERPSWMRVSRSRVALISGGALVLGLVIALAAGAPGAIDDGWENFKNPNESTAIRQDSTFSRLASLSGRGRYQFWQAAAEQQASKPWQGTGAGTWEYWWARNPIEERGFVRDAHSLYMQTFGELGLVGAAVLGGFLLWLLASGIGRALSAREELRLPLAAAAGGIAAFLLDATVDWIWQLTVLPVALMFLAAVVLSSEDSRPSRPRMRSRVVVGVMAAIALPVLGVQLAGSSAVADSQTAAERNDLAQALDYARTAVRAQPYAATPRLQEALVLELAGDLDGAATAARAATEKEPTNWRTWLIRSRVEAERGRTGEALTHFRRARSLNPQSPIFRTTR